MMKLQGETGMRNNEKGHNSQFSISHKLEKSYAMYSLGK